MMLGDDRLGLPMPLLLPPPTPPPRSTPTPPIPPVCPVGPPTCWLWFSTLRNQKQKKLRASISSHELIDFLL
ncbi:hypothetical protein EYF80_043130 [Liparis tanakae]|uniref:Uncharacterized protein n=1 Tax=Liparis tanakae TaxID=230148 RepID=A0A4Z2G084_9TELE|nr:hypothetical protein EYF80_043130 [Liparis tanakae]